MGEPVMKRGPIRALCAVAVATASWPLVVDYRVCSSLDATGKTVCIKALMHGDSRAEAWRKGLVSDMDDHGFNFAH